MSDMLSVHQAADKILHSLSPLSAIKKPLGEVLGYYLAEDIKSERDYPPFDRITMDGIAINYGAFTAGKRSFAIEDYAAAGHPQLQLKNPQNAIEVGTGAPMPQGCDTIIPYEQLTMREGEAELHADAKVTQGDALHARASDAKLGQVLLTRGQYIGVPEIAVLAGNGIGHVSVYSKPSIGILATGNELVASDAPIEPYQIRRSNDRTLQAALALNGFNDVETGWVPDDKQAITEHLVRWVNHKNIVLITGGVSKGARDYVPEVLKDLGVEEIFHRVAQRPGKPLWFGRKANALVFGLPGNPNSSLTCLVRYVLAPLHMLSGGGKVIIRPKQLAAPVKPHAELTQFLPVSLDTQDRAMPLTTRNSGDFTGLLGSDGFVEIPPAMSANEAMFYPWRLR